VDLAGELTSVEAEPRASDSIPLPALEERVLVERVLDGESEAFGELVSAHLERAYRVAYRLMHHREDAEDVVQDALISALEKLDSFDVERSFGPWLQRIVVNRALNARKARSVRSTEALPLDLSGGGRSPVDAAADAELRDRLLSAMTELSDTQRDLVRLFELEGFAGPELGEMFDMPAGTVRWHLHQARKALRAALTPYERSSG
jgi:RNA polymerase sigma-70 factor, ECF subfamily